MDKKESLTYAVVILRRDGDFIRAYETQKFEEAKSTWNTLHDRWVESLKESIPFKMVMPIYTCFDPGLIKEIRIVAESVSDNPYEQDMRNKGFSEAFRGTAATGGMLDQGYK